MRAAALFRLRFGAAVLSPKLRAAADAFEALVATAWLVLCLLGSTTRYFASRHAATLPKATPTSKKVIPPPAIPASHVKAS